MDLTLSGYLLYGMMGPLTSVAVASYLKQRWDSLEWPTRIFTLCAAANFAADGASKMWFAIWRIIGKPPWMPDHAIVEIVTLIAALAAFGAFWFWTRRRIGDAKPFAIGLAILAGALILPALLPG
jgi:hypothetical protein